MLLDNNICNTFLHKVNPNIKDMNGTLVNKRKAAYKSLIANGYCPLYSSINAERASDSNMKLYFTAFSYTGIKMVSKVIVVSLSIQETLYNHNL